MHLRFRYKVRGGHVHVRVFGDLTKSDNMAKCGDLTFRTEEWEPLKRQFAIMGFQSIDESEE